MQFFDIEDDDDHDNDSKPGELDNSTTREFLTNVSNREKQEESWYYRQKKSWKQLIIDKSNKQRNYDWDRNSIRW